MTEIIIPFPDDLRDKAELAAKGIGLTLDQFIRRCVMEIVENRADDPMFAKYQCSVETRLPTWQKNTTNIFTEINRDLHRHGRVSG